MLAPTYFAILGFCFIANKFLKIKPEVTPILIISTIIITMYAFTYLGLINAASNIIIGLGSIYAIYFIFSSYKSNIISFFTPGITIWILITTLLSFMTINLGFSEWDEFTHWGAHSKLIWLNKRFLTNNEIVDHITYPPGASLFHYLFYKTSGYSEKLAYLAHLLIILSPMCLLVQNFNWKEWKNPVTILLSTLTIAIILKTKIGLTATLYMDSIIAIWLGAILVQGLKANNLKEKIILLPIIFAFSLFKVKILPLVLVVACVLLTNWIYLYYVSDRSNNDRKNLITNCLIFMGVISSAIIATKSWNLYLASENINKEWQLNISFSQLLAAFFYPNTTQQLIINNFTKKAIGHLSYIIIFFTLIALTIYKYKNKTDKIRFVILHSLILCALAAYYFGLLFMYLFTFTEYEAINLLSMSRYVNVFYLMWSILIIYELLINSAQDLKTNNVSKNIILASLFAAFLYLSFFKHIKIYNHLPIKNNVQELASLVKSNTPIDSKVFTIWQNATGFEKAIMSYEILPRKSKSGYATIGKKYIKNDVWTKDITQLKFMQDISKFDYLLLAYTDDNFWNNYGSIFYAEKSKIKPLTKYKICRGNEFNSVYNKSCIQSIEPAFLFKVSYTNNILELKNIIDDSIVLRKDLNERKSSSNSDSML